MSKDGKRGNTGVAKKGKSPTAEGWKRNSQFPQSFDGRSVQTGEEKPLDHSKPAESSSFHCKNLLRTSSPVVHNREKERRSSKSDSPQMTFPRVLEGPSFWRKHTVQDAAGIAAAKAAKPPAVIKWRNGRRRKVCLLSATPLGGLQKESKEGQPNGAPKTAW